MAVHLCRTFEQGLERIPAERERNAHADRAPERIAAAHALGELEDPGLVDALFDRGFRPGGDRDHPPFRILDACFSQPRPRRIEVRQCFQGRKGLRRDHDQSRCWIERLHGLVERRAVDVREEADPERGRRRPSASTTRAGPNTEPPMPMCRIPVSVAERARLDCIDQRAHTLAPHGCEIDVLGRPAAALRDMGGRPPLAWIDDCAGEQGIARGRKAQFFGTGAKVLDQVPRQVGLRPVEIDSRRFEGEVAEAVRLGGEQLIEPFDRLLLHRRPHIVPGSLFATPG